MTDQIDTPVKQFSLWLQIILLAGKVQTGRASVFRMIRFTAALKWWQLVVLSAVSIAWVVLVYSTIGDALNRFMLSTFFRWLPDYFQIGRVFENPELYTRGMRLCLWILSLVFGSLLGPFVEELYFRGFLLPRMSYPLNLVSDVLLAIPILLF